MKRISVLMGIYNCASTLPQALDSLLNQTFKEFQIILCDDGSQDETFEVAEKYASKYHNIVLLRNDVNRGLNYTLNKCLDYVDTEYVARMDGDDLCDPMRFEKEINFLDNHPEYALVSTNMHYFDDDGVFFTGHREGEPTMESYLYESPFCHAPCMARTEAFKTVGGYSDFDLVRRVEDYHLWMKMRTAGYRGYNLPEALYSMRDDRNAAVRRNPKARRNEAYVKYQIWKNFHLPWYKIIYCARPLILAYMPNWLYTYLHKRRK